MTNLITSSESRRLRARAFATGKPYTQVFGEYNDKGQWEWFWQTFPSDKRHGPFAWAHEASPNQRNRR